jgi:anti-anti-sigma factor
MQIIRETDHVRLIAEEDFLVTHAGSLQGQLISGVEGIQSGKLILDLSRTTHMDSTGIKLVIGLLKTCQQKGVALQIEVASPSILQLFHICKLNQILDIKEVVANG